MQLWVGLGNPGAKYRANRHNIGWMAVERIADDHGFAPWRGKFQGQIAEGRLGPSKVLLLRPETFMNDSGRSVRAACDFYKIEAGDVTVFHDELDLAPGRVKVKAGGGHAGHNGLRSLHAHIGEAYTRVRLGIGHPGHKDRVAGFVLSDFAKAEQEWLDDVLRGVADGAPALAAGDGPGFMNAVAQRTAPPRSSKSQPKGQGDPQRGSAATAEAQPSNGSHATTPSQGGAQAATGADASDTRSALQKLVDRFR